jgi:hypothetical protein
MPLVFFKIIATITILVFVAAVLQYLVLSFLFVFFGISYCSPSDACLGHGMLTEPAAHNASSTFWH